MRYVLTWIAVFALAFVAIFGVIVVSGDYHPGTEKIHVSNGKGR